MMLSKQQPSRFAQLSHQLLQIHNTVRRDPAALVPYFSDRLNYYRDILYFVKDRPNTAIRTVEGDKPVRELINHLQELVNNNNQLPELKANKNLDQAATDHAKDMGETGLFQHQGSNGKNLKQRVSMYTKWRGHLVQNIECGYSNAQDILASLLIDDGLASRAHRKAILNPELKHVGISCQSHKIYGLITVIVYATELIEEDAPQVRNSENLEQRSPSVDLGNSQRTENLSVSHFKDVVHEGQNPQLKGQCNCRVF